MKSKMNLIAALGGIVTITACAPLLSPWQQSYWQRGEDNYLAGPKEQQALHDDIAACVHKVNDSTSAYDSRGTLPSDPYINYRWYQETSNDLAYVYHDITAHYDTPYYYGNREHSDPSGYNNTSWYYDSSEYYGDRGAINPDFVSYESCMQSKNWLRVRYARHSTNYGIIQETWWMRPR